MSTTTPNPNPTSPLCTGYGVITDADAPDLDKLLADSDRLLGQSMSPVSSHCFDVLK